MPVIQVQDKQHTLKQGQTRVGAGAGVDVAVPGDPSLGVQAIFDTDAQNRVVIRRANESSAVRVNGVTLADPTPLMHGDKVDVAGTEILFSEDKKVGATQFVSASDIGAIAAKRSGPARATASTGGRLVSLVDGKEYQIPAAGITFGREAGSDVVVAQAEVSRRHATITPGEGGYVLADHSTNGVWVNGTRVQGSQLLARADVVRVGSEEFRFYADVASAKPTPSSAAAPSPAAAAMTEPAAATSQRATPPTSAPAMSSEPVAAAPAAPVGAVTGPPRQPPAASTAPRQSPAPAAAAAKGASVSARPEPATAPAPLKPPGAPRPKPPAAPPAPAKKKGGVPAWVWIVVLVVVAAAAYFLGMQGRG